MCQAIFKHTASFATPVCSSLKGRAISHSFLGHQRIAEDLSRRETLLLVGFNVPSLKILDMPEVSQACTMCVAHDAHVDVAHILVLEDDA